MQRLSAYSVFAYTKDKRLVSLFQEGSISEKKSLKNILSKNFTIKKLSLEHFFLVIHKLQDIAFLKDIFFVLRNTFDFHSKYLLSNQYGKVIIDHGYKKDFSLGGRLALIVNKIKKRMENYE